MKERTEPGFATSGLVILAALLSVLLAIALPVIKSDAPLRAADWLGFSGAFVGGIMTLIAAAVAWTVAQKQIAAQTALSESQNAIQKFNILDERHRLLSVDDILSTRLLVAANGALIIRDGYFSVPPPHKVLVGSASTAITAEKALLESALTEYRRAEDNGRAFAEAAGARSQLAIAALKFMSILIELEGKARVADLATSEHGNATAENWSACQAIDLTTPLAVVVERCEIFQSLLRKERNRIVSLKDKIQIAQGF